MKHIL